MIAVDTNILVRLLTCDDAKQAGIARTLFARNQIWIAKTVLLETSWVLSSLYGFKGSAIREAFIKLLGLDGVQVEDEAGVSAALEFMSKRVDFADALHLSSRPAGVVFVTFDRVFARRLQRAGVARVEAAGG